MEDEGSAHEAIFYVLSYLPLHQLLIMSQVSKSIRDVIRDDVLIWLHIVVENPLSRRLTDDILIQITSKARGRLRTLALLDCANITDAGILQVVHANRFLNKLYVPGCTRLTPGGIIRAVERLAAQSAGFTCLKISGIYNISKEDLFTLQSYVSQSTQKQPVFYQNYWSSSFRSIDEYNSVIDVEICPKCEEVKLVFDCPKESDCRGCLQCITRCIVCGRCISEQDADEQGDTLCNDSVCLDCWLCLPKCNHCNKPFCPRHTYKQLNHHGSEGFVCDVCQAKSLSDYWEE
ncbi:unnamed protein product [Amaranthus hypochondriacus]